VTERKEDLAHGAFALFRTISVAGFALELVWSIEQVITHDGVNLGTAHEAALCLESTEQVQSCRYRNRRVDAVLDAGKDCHKDSRKEDEDLEWGYPPELVHGVGWCDQVSYGVNNDGSECGVWNVPKHSGEGVNCEQHNDSCYDTGEGSSHSSLGLNGGSRERSSRWVSSKERTKAVCNADCNKLLRRIDHVVVDSAERLGDGDVLDKESNDGRWQL